MIRAVLTHALLILAALPAHSDDPLSTVRGLLDAGDIAGLEQALADPDSAPKAERAATLRAVNVRLFETSHPARIAVLHRWAEERPASHNAATAEAWEGRMHHAGAEGETWMLGAQLAQADRDPSDILVAEVFWENAIGHALQDPSQILTWFYFMNQARDAGEARLAAGDTAARDPAAAL